MPQTEQQQRDIAMQMLKSMVQDARVPTLTQGELDDLLDSQMPPLVKRAVIWKVNTAFSYGDVVMPTIRNGHRYICIQYGTTDTATEPLWPKNQAATIMEGAPNSDGTMLTWQEAGPDYSNIYDVRRAAHRGWLLKASKAANSYDVTMGGQSFKRNQLYEHCIAQAMQFAPLGFNG